MAGIGLNELKITYPKYYKQYAYALAHKMNFLFFSLFLHFKAKMDSFLNNELVNFDIVDPTMYRKSNFVFILSHENKKHTSS